MVKHCTEENREEYEDKLNKAIGVDVGLAFLATVLLVIAVAVCEFVL